MVSSKKLNVVGALEFKGIKCSVHIKITGKNEKIMWITSTCVGSETSLAVFGFVESYVCAIIRSKLRLET